MQTVSLQNSDKVILVDDEDYLSVVGQRWSLAPSGIPRAYIRGRGRMVIAQFLTGKKDIDHADRNMLNNQRSNLREIGRSGQQQNRNGFKNNTSGYKGVSFHRGKWQARIRIGGTLIYLGRFDTIELGAKAYDKAAFQAWGDNASLNFPRG
jgi:hypothetical protein